MAYSLTDAEVLAATRDAILGGHARPSLNTRSRTLDLDLLWNGRWYEIELSATPTRVTVMGPSRPEGRADLPADMVTAARQRYLDETDGRPAAGAPRIWHVNDPTLPARDPRNGLTPVRNLTLPAELLARQHRHGVAGVAQLVVDLLAADGPTVAVDAEDADTVAALRAAYYSHDPAGPVLRDLADADVLIVEQMPLVRIDAQWRCVGIVNPRPAALD